ncbi:hypothetical protein ACHAW5_009484 [Stephanodiscus triporus]|uniref:Protein kinase domain-containing protein n=1 Tax=Stephanodiscus triporus TaxID=2934178 RepID=A0ABD3NJS5_9STRA
MLPLDLLSDENNLYSITPYCNGGRLLDRVERKGRFSEPEARYWMRQILKTPCGKWYYLSPEVCLSEGPFDGPAVDLWAAGVILFVMLTGSPPWEEPKLADDNFRLMTTGHMSRMLEDRRAGLSADAMDLLQSMLHLDPADRLSLEQVCAHPWMTHSEHILP